MRAVSRFRVMRQVTRRRGKRRGPAYESQRTSGLPARATCSRAGRTRSLATRRLAGAPTACSSRERWTPRDDCHAESTPEASAVLGPGFSLALFTLLELFPQVPGLVRAALVLVGLGLAVSAGQRLALGQLLLALTALELLEVRVVRGHTQTLIECAELPGCAPSQESLV